MSPNRIRPVEEERDRRLVGGVEHRRRRAAPPARRDAERERRETARRRPARRSAARARPDRSVVPRCPATRSGCVSAYSTGSSMLGTPSCASTLPSTNSTNECTTLCGCTTTSIRSYGSPNRKCASITSSALLASVALSTVILRPMRHVGCRSASSSVARSSCSVGPSAERAARRGDDDAPNLDARVAR